MSTLTRRELQVVNLIGQGYEDKIIARKLKISVRTVQAHTRAAHLKLAVTRPGRNPRVMLALYGYESQLSQGA